METPVEKTESTQAQKVATKVEEVFGNPDLTTIDPSNKENLKLYGNQSYTIWELREFREKSKDKNVQEEAYEKLLRKVGWFDNILMFHQVWNKIPHSKVNQVLADTDNSQFRIYEDEDAKQYTVDGIMMFKTGVKPKWEDPVNKDGGEWRIDIGVREDSVLQKIWETLVFTPLTGEFPHAEDGLAGVRFIQKVKNDALMTYRIEVWLQKDK